MTSCCIRILCCYVLMIAAGYGQPLENPLQQQCQHGSFLDCKINPSKTERFPSAFPPAFSTAFPINYLLLVEASGSNFNFDRYNPYLRRESSSVKHKTSSVKPLSPDEGASVQIDNETYSFFLPNTTSTTASHHYSLRQAADTTSTSQTRQQTSTSENNTSGGTTTTGAGTSSSNTVPGLSQVTTIQAPSPSPPPPPTPKISMPYAAKINSREKNEMSESEAKDCDDNETPKADSLPNGSGLDMVVLQKIKEKHGQCSEASGDCYQLDTLNLDLKTAKSEMEEEIVLSEDQLKVLFSGEDDEASLIDKTATNSHYQQLYPTLMYLIKLYVTDSFTGEWLTLSVSALQALENIFKKYDQSEYNKFRTIIRQLFLNSGIEYYSTIGNKARLENALGRALLTNKVSARHELDLFTLGKQIIKKIPFGIKSEKLRPIELQLASMIAEHFDDENFVADIKSRSSYYSMLLIMLSDSRVLYLLQKTYSNSDLSEYNYYIQSIATYFQVNYEVHAENALTIASYTVWNAVSGNFGSFVPDEGYQGVTSSSCQNIQILTLLDSLRPILKRNEILNERVIRLFLDPVLLLGLAFTYSSYVDTLRATDFLKVSLEHLNTATPYNALQSAQYFYRQLLPYISSLNPMLLTIPSGNNDAISTLQSLGFINGQEYLIYSLLTRFFPKVNLESSSQDRIREMIISMIFKGAIFCQPK